MLCNNPQIVLPMLLLLFQLCEFFEFYKTFSVYIFIYSIYMKSYGELKRLYISLK